MSGKCECPECGNVHRLNGVAGGECTGRLAAAGEEIVKYKKLLNAAVDLLVADNGSPRTVQDERVVSRALEYEAEATRRRAK